jgi:Zn-dependent peptidase ImmA (M78 family)
VLKVRLEEPAVIPRDPNRRDFEIAGFIDRNNSRIVVAEKYPFESRRFTIAHEAGHWVLHPGLVYHRDRPLTAGASTGGRSQIELEADLFAAELLMPAKAVRQWFEGTFGRPIQGREMGADVAAWLSAGTGRNLNEIELIANLRSRSLAVAHSRSFYLKHFRPLCEVFGVSHTAMAIRLEQLELVT